ncbi:hypothetical protein B4U80_08054 [Leptotrombidium deliense]|uniref:Levanase-like protein n=1 Tax=Leptotrombidium deliense TaxID=299467 RepID=A0A443STN4_9ACAR|nr:hypothetical protein B4U80_08054 [Leptotrombidium deliense]
MVESNVKMYVFVENDEKTKGKISPMHLFYLAVALTVISFVTIIYYPKTCKELPYSEMYRPQVHYSLPSNWMNDPNGLVFHNGVYHLFYQYHPYSKEWGPMHWGHATSKDLLHWNNLPTALYPNELGAIFSGCALVDKRNVTGLQLSKSTNVLIAIFTQHLEDGSSSPIERQSLAYSNDHGLTWKMYGNNPILESPGHKDFRDPKVIPYKDHYIMLVVAGEKVFFYKSYNLTDWQKLSEFGDDQGKHGGVWECPDLFTLTLDGEEYWILLVSINPQGPNGGSATQYFVGFFDGEKFINYNEANKTLWIDYGPDSYAGVTWYGISYNTRLFISWMNNWDYCKDIPTDPWRGQMSIPRILMLKAVGNYTYLTSTPVPVLNKLRQYKPMKPLEYLDDYIIEAGGHKVILDYDVQTNNVYDVELLMDIESIDKSCTIEVCFSNNQLESLCAGFSRYSKEYFIDRSNSGKINFHKNFTKVSKAKRVSKESLMYWRLIVDVSSIEFFADEGLTVMTSLFFPHQKYNHIQLKLVSNNLNSKAVIKLKSVNLYTLKSIWR